MGFNQSGVCNGLPPARPGFDTLNLAAPALIQMNLDGEWETSKPLNLNEERLKAVVGYLANSEAGQALKSYCQECASSNKNKGLSSNYVPIIMMPIYSDADCPFNLNDGLAEMKYQETKPTGKIKNKDDGLGTKDKKEKKPNRKPFLMQRLTDFDLLSQW